MIIPKIIHQIWIGPNKIPKVWMDTITCFCNKYNYQYILWDDNVVNNFKLTNKKYYDIEKTFNGKSDILRYEILYNYGGIYIDADCIILKEDMFENLINNFINSNYSIAFGYEKDNELITGSVIISTINSSFIKLCIDKVKKRNFNKPAWKSVGPRLITKIYNNINDKSNICIYPSVVLYPISWKGINTIDYHTKINIPAESVMFQYGYSTNKLKTIFNT
jgi:mannosyltransferase OCH1-like enzyme